MEATELNIIKPYLVVILYLWTHLYNHLCTAFVLDLHIAKAFFSYFCAYICQRTLIFIFAAFLNNSPYTHTHSHTLTLINMLDIQG